MTMRKYQFLSKGYLSLLTLILVTLSLQACATTSEGEKARLLLANLAKENKLCCVEKGYVGIGGLILNQENKIEIVHVYNDSPAGKTGILPGDIILKIDDEEIKDKYQAFRIYNSKYPGDETSLTVKRKGKIITKHFQVTSHYFLNITYKLAELVYRDVPVRLAMIPGKVNFDSPKDRQEFDKFETYLVALLESGFITSHGSHNNFAIIDRQKTDSVLNELKFQESGLVDNKDRVKLGNMLGATHLVIIDFSSQIPADNKPEVLITMRLIEIESDKNIATSPLKIKSQQSVDVVQRDLIDYINNKLKRITHLEKDSMAKYNNIRNNLSKQESLDILTNNVIPLYGNFLSELQMINPNTDEVNTIHKLYISGASLQYEGFRALETSIIQKNARQFREANIKLKEGKEKINQFNEAISQLRIKHKVVSKKRDE